MTVLFALLGAKALYLTYLWLGSAIAAAYLADRKGYAEKSGLAAGLLLNVLGVILWLALPAKDESMWKTVGPWGSQTKADRAAEEQSAAEPAEPTAAE